MAEPGRPAVIGLDGRNLALENGTGVATYAGTLAGCLPLVGLQAEILSAAPALPRPSRWLAASWRGPARAVRTTKPDGSVSWTAPDVFRIAQVHFDIWRRLRPVSGGMLPDIMHWTYPLPLRMVGRPNLYTIHDLIPLLEPTLTGIEGGRFRRLLACIAHRATHLVTVSEATRRDIIDQLGVAPDRVTNTGQAVDVTAVRDACIPGLVRGEYWLHVGAVERRKNLGRLIDAWRASGSPHTLVLAGPDGWNGAEHLVDAPLSGPGPSVVRIRWLERPRLLGLIRDARALLMPSLAEGFGLPVAEAMALGTPVMTSGRGALAEVAGSAALLVDPLDVQGMTEALRALDADPALRSRLGAAGLVQVQPFTRTRYAARLAALYTRVASHPGDEAPVMPSTTGV